MARTAFSSERAIFLISLSLAEEDAQLRQASCLNSRALEEISSEILCKSPFSSFFGMFTRYHFSLALMGAKSRRGAMDGKGEIATVDTLFP